MLGGDNGDLADAVRVVLCVVLQRVALGVERDELEDLRVGGGRDVDTAKPLHGQRLACPKIPRAQPFHSFGQRRTFLHGGTSRQSKPWIRRRSESGCSKFNAWKG